MAAVLDSTILETEERGPSSRRGAIKATSFQFQYFMLWLDVNTASNVPTISRAYQHVNHSFAVQLFFFIPRASEALPNGITTTTQHLKTHICSLRLLHHLTEAKG